MPLQPLESPGGAAWASKLRHLNCEGLWIQAKARSKEVTLVNVLRSSNPADILTKYLDPKTLQSELKTIHMRSSAGRPDTAPATAHRSADCSLYDFSCRSSLLVLVPQTLCCWQLLATYVYIIDRWFVLPMATENHLRWFLDRRHLNTYH